MSIRAGRRLSMAKKTDSPLQKDLGLVLDNFFKGYSEESSIDNGTWDPSLVIKDEGYRFLISVDIPGVKKEDINLSIENNILLIDGERITKQNKGQLTRSTFHRRLTLPSTSDENNISAKYRQGILEITIPKKVRSTLKQIEIK